MYFFRLLLSVTVLTILSHPLRGAELDEQLALLIPGTGLQESSGRLYAQQQLEVLFARLEEGRIRRKNSRKQLALLQNEIEEMFLDTFALQADFHALIKHGQYNQSTASALYAVVFDHFDIPYQLQVEACDLVVILPDDPQLAPVTISGTQPLSELAAGHFRNEFAKLVRHTNYLAAHEQDFPDKDLFERYYIRERVALSLKDAAAFLYFQQALVAFDTKSWSRSQDYLGKAKRLSGHPMFEVLERAIWLQLANQPGNSRESTYYLWKLWEERPGQPWQDELLLHFDHQIKQLSEPSIWQIDSIYNVYQQGFGDAPAAQARLREHYFVLSARQRAEAGHTVEVLNLMDSLYSMRPDDQGVQDILASTMVWSLRRERNYTEGLRRVAYYQDHYPFLASNKIFQDQQLFYQAEQVHAAFQGDNEQAGLGYLAEFEQLLRNSGATPRRTLWVTTAYLAVSNYYFRQRSYPQARMYIDRALSLAPADDYLLHRRDLLGRY